MIYEILLIKEEVEGSGSAAAGAKAVRWTLPTTKAPPNQDPSEVLMRTWPSIKPKRAELADAVPLRSTGSTALLYFAPVNRATEPRSSADGSFADTLKQWPGSHWAPLSMVLDSLRPLREAAFKFSADTVALIAALDGWLSASNLSSRAMLGVASGCELGHDLPEDASGQIFEWLSGVIGSIAGQPPRMGAGIIHADASGPSCGVTDMVLRNRSEPDREPALG